MTDLRIILIDDHEVVRMGLRMLLEQMENVNIIAEGGSASDAIHLCNIHRPDVVIMDIRMPPGDSGIEACRTIVDEFPQTQVIMLTSYAEDELISNAIEAGAVGYVLKQGGTGELLRALEAVRQGAAALDPGITRRVMAMMRKKQEKPVDPFANLTPRELDILRLVTDGKTNGQIAETVFLSDKTVRNHISTILSKLGIKNRVEAATFALENGLREYKR